MRIRETRSKIICQIMLIFCIASGAAEGTRTPDPIITNDVLYQLSYSGTFW